MLSIPYAERILLGERVPSLGQLRVMREIPAFSEPDLVSRTESDAASSDCIRAAVFNVEHGNRMPEIVSFLRSCEELKHADILFGNELDDGTERSGNIDASRVLAEELGFNYAYALEFIELVNPNDQKGYEGNTLFSRWPIVRAEALHLPEGYNWYFDEQKRIGERVALFCELDVAGKRLGAVCVHLENRTVPALRAAQTEAILKKADEMFGTLPILIGGDFNSNAFDYSEASAAAAYARQKVDGTVVDPTSIEPLFDAAERAGFDYRSLNGTHLPTRRRPTGDGTLKLHLDWIFGRGVTCVRHGMVSTLLESGAKADASVPEESGMEPQLSDHNAVWADVRL